jgi:hypothetical protein
MFAQALLHLGHRVWIIMPEPAEVDQWVQENCTINLNQFKTFNWQEASSTYNHFGRFKNALSTLQKWKQINNKIEQLVRQQGSSVDLVFFTWLDSYLSNYLHPFVLDRFFRFAWSGLYFHPRHMRLNPESLGRHPSPSDIDIALTSARCTSIAIHDEGIVHACMWRLSKPAILFPEIADVSPPASDYAPALEVRKRAKGRLVVGMIGQEWRKGTMTLLRLAKMAPVEEFFFVFAGHIHVNSFSEEEKRELQALIDGPGENCYCYMDYVPEGENFNALLCSFDIPFIVYNDFPSSSNILTKSAYFKKFVISSERFCIGEDVKQYDLGLTVEEGNVVSCLKALQELKEKIIKQEYPENSALHYTKIHSVNTLQEKFSETLLLLTQ